MKVIIVGGVAGGASAAARLRRLDEHAEILLLERGEHISFANCGLPYYIGGEIRQRAALMLQTPESFRARFRVDVRIASEVLAIDREARTVTVRHAGETYLERYDKLILSPGAEPVRPPIPGAEGERVFTLRTIPDADRIKAYLSAERPRSAAVIGAGAIGLEVAENLARAGVEVTLIERLEQVFASLDADMAAEVHAHLREHGVRLMLGVEVLRIEEAGRGLRIGTNRGAVDAGLAILSVGVRPESALAQEAGLELGARGAIVVDAGMRTSDPNIYAVGDAVEIADFVSGERTVTPLAGPANKQGRIAADNLCGIPSRFAGTQGSAVLRVFGLTAAVTGLGERTARRLGMDCEKSFTWSADHAEYYPGAQRMSIKTLFERGTGKILGAQVVGGEGAAKRCDVLATAIRLGATAADLTDLELCYAPPYSSAKDPVNMAGFVIENLRSGKVELFHWHDVPAIQADSDALLLDVRTVGEYARGHITGALNIPLDALRGRLDELDKGKKLYVNCHSGQRSYLACRILSQHGWRCANLSGGYRLYALQNPMHT